jgi:hypothetical protein
VSEGSLPAVAARHRARRVRLAWRARTEEEVVVLPTPPLPPTNRNFKSLSSTRDLAVMLLADAAAECGALAAAAGGAGCAEPEPFLRRLRSGAISTRDSPAARGREAPCSPATARFPFGSLRAAPDSPGLLRDHHRRRVRLRDFKARLQDEGGIAPQNYQKLAWWLRATFCFLARTLTDVAMIEACWYPAAWRGRAG